MRLRLSDWPDMPAPPGRDEVVVVRLSRAAPRPELRALCRETIRALLVAWGHAQAALVETEHGPVIEGAGALAVSLSYAENRAWIALASADAVGVDATPVRDFAELADVARLYLRTEAERILADPSPRTAFAAAWSRHEATLKCRRLPLREENPETPPPSRHLTVRDADVMLSVAWPA